MEFVKLNNFHLLRNVFKALCNYYILSSVPLFLPDASSNSIPANIQFLPSLSTLPIGPMYLRVPRRLPICEEAITRSPICNVPDSKILSNQLNAFFGNLKKTTNSIYFRVYGVHCCVYFVLEKLFRSVMV